MGRILACTRAPHGGWQTGSRGASMQSRHRWHGSARGRMPRHGTPGPPGARTEATQEQHDGIRLVSLD